MTTPIKHGIPRDVVRWLGQIPTDRPVIMLLRHSVRGPIPLGTPGQDVPLTEEGENLALELGRVVGNRLGRVFSSPVGRCVMTGVRLAEGAGAAREVALDRMLGEPGVFVVDGHVSWPIWLERGHAAVMESLMRCDPPLPGFAGGEEAARQLALHTLRACDSGPGIHVFVTHDAVLLPAVSRLLEQFLAPEDWPTFLDAAFMWVEEERLVVCYHAHRNELSLPLYGLTDLHAIELARREVGATVGHNSGVRFFVAGGTFKTLITGRPAADLDLWAPSSEDRRKLVDRLVKRGARQSAGEFADKFEIHGRVVEVPHRTEPATLAERLGRSDIALSAVGVEHSSDGVWSATIHPLALESARRREVLLLRPLVNWRYALATLERMRRYATELGYSVPPDEEDEIWRTFDAQDAEMKQGMIDRFGRTSRGGHGVLEEALCRFR